MRSPEIRITDLAKPVFSDLEKQAMAAAPPVEMNMEKLLGAACAATGLSDFGPGDFRERLALWLKSFDEDKDLNTLGRATVYDQALRYASGRLRIEDLLKRHPEILQVKIDRPIIVSGLPRSGTTHLVNVLATNPNLRSMPFWESMEPVPDAAEEVSFESSENNPRYRRCREMWQIVTTVLEHWAAMHEMEPDHIHEEVELHGMDFSSQMPEWMTRIPQWTEYYYKHDQTPHYVYARKIIQAMTWLKGPNRWVMKSTENMENLLPLLSTYPDATIVITHRDPVAVLQSSLMMTAYWDRIRRTRNDLHALAELWIPRVEHLLHNCVRDRDALPDNQVIDVMFHDYMADQRALIAKVYQIADLQMTPEADRRIIEYLNGNARHKLGRVIYDLKGDFGVDVAALRRRYQFYYDRFPVKQELTLGE